MRNRKVQLRFFDVMDYEKEASYLSDMHSKGWKFTHVTFPGIYHFTKCEPARVRYQLDYNKDGIQHKEEYTQMFADCGWEYLLDFVGYSYFRKPEEDDTVDEEIFCDDDSRYDMVMRVFKGKIIPLIVIFLACLCPAFVATIHSIAAGKTDFYSTLIVLVLFCILYLSIFVRFVIKFSAFKKSLAR